MYFLCIFDVMFLEFTYFNVFLSKEMMRALCLCQPS